MWAHWFVSSKPLFFKIRKNLLTADLSDTIEVKTTLIRMILNKG